MPLALQFKPFNSFFSSKMSLSCDFCSGICFPKGTFVRSGKKWRFQLMAAELVAMAAVVVVHPHLDFCPRPSEATPYRRDFRFLGCLFGRSSCKKCCPSESLPHSRFLSVY